MTCDAIHDGELIEAYLLGHLTEEEQAQFEEHYFGCDRCFAALETVRALRTELGQPSSTVSSLPQPSDVPGWRRLAWAAALGGLVAAGALAVWMSRPGALDAPQGDPPVVVAEGPAAPVQPESPAPEPAAAPDATPAPGEASSPSAPPRPSLAELARFEPPPFFALTVRGETPAPAAEAFREAMTHYMARDYPRAEAALAAVVERDPSSAAGQFYLGISALRNGRREIAIRALRATLALGESAHFEDANFFLAKAHLGEGQVAAARVALDRTIGLAGDREAEARRLLKQLGDR
ncbi:MAG: zf-HC2 domain-containing protein [Acidobacteria bacterium]|nr:zf-HC2 domain-containing protein [Acidobacteriota bacterium]